MPENRQTFQLRVAGAVSTGVKDSWQAPFDLEIVGVAARIITAPTGASLIADLKLDGTTMYTTTANRPTIAASANESADPDGTGPLAAGTSVRPDVVAVTAGQTVTLDVLQVGSTVAGSDLEVTVAYVGK